MSEARILTAEDIGKWQVETNLPTPRYYPGVVTHDKEIFVLGGTTQSDLSPILEIYNTSAQT